MQYQSPKEQELAHSGMRLQPRQDGSVEQSRREINFSTLAGRRDQIEIVIERWRQLIGPGLRSVRPPLILPIPNSAQQSEVLRIAVIRHGSGLTAEIVNRLRVQLRFPPFDGMMVEAGYFSTPCATPAGTSEDHDWPVRWNPKHSKALESRFRVPVHRDLMGGKHIDSWGSPCRIALIDTGDSRASLQTGFDTDSCDEEVPVDYYGHGTAVGDLIRLTAPRAEIHSYRVMRPRERIIESPILLNAMIYATLSTSAHNIVVIPQRAVILDPYLHGQDNIMQKTLRRNDVQGCPTPVIVCAAGNDGHHESMGYPASIPGVVVAVALDWFGKPASYNCRAPVGVRPHTVGAVGGVKEDPLGYLTESGQSVKALYGSSYATALVAGALAGRH